MDFKLKEIEKSGFDIKKICMAGELLLALVHTTYISSVVKIAIFFKFSIFLKLIPVYLFCWKLNIFSIQYVEFISEVV